MKFKWINTKNPLVIVVLLLMFMVAMSLVCQQDSIAQPDGYATKIVRSADSITVYSGGTIEIQSGGSLDIQSGADADISGATISSSTFSDATITGGSLSDATITCGTDTFSIQGFTPMVTQYSAVTSASSATAAVSGLDANDYLVASLNTYVTNGATLVAAQASVECATLVFSTTPSAIVNVTIQAWKD